MRLLLVHFRDESGTSKTWNPLVKKNAINPTCALLKLSEVVRKLCWESLTAKSMIQKILEAISVENAKQPI